MVDAPGEPLRFVSMPGCVRVQGDLIRPQIEALTSHALPMPEGQAPGSRLEIALGQVRAVDTVGVAFLLGWQASAQARSVALRYTHPPKALRAMAELYGLAALMPFEGL
ncbi:lipid asymmetry maintenance protein MlaB [Halothiobacillus sp. DCM-1]|uniref:STAS domain-containing protein n=1 Tax=Halothiobacillus sp. DCM-1 TaxID=3112558 RepID=UPI003248C438